MRWCRSYLELVVILVVVAASAQARLKTPYMASGVFETFLLQYIRVQDSARHLAWYPISDHGIRGGTRSRSAPWPPLLAPPAHPALGISRRQSSYYYYYYYYLFFFLPPRRLTTVGPRGQASESVRAGREEREKG